MTWASLQHQWVWTFFMEAQELEGTRSALSSLRCGALYDITSGTVSFYAVFWSELHQPVQVERGVWVGSPSSSPFCIKVARVAEGAWCRETVPGNCLHKGFRTRQSMREITFQNTMLTFLYRTVCLWKTVRIETFPLTNSKIDLNTYNIKKSCVFFVVVFNDYHK